MNKCYLLQFQVTFLFAQAHKCTTNKDNRVTVTTPLSLVSLRRFKMQIILLFSQVSHINQGDVSRQTCDCCILCNHIARSTENINRTIYVLHKYKNIIAFSNRSTFISLSFQVSQDGALIVTDLTFSMWQVGTNELYQRAVVSL